MKTVIRILRSIADYLTFYEIRLSAHPFIYVVLAVAVAISSVAVSILGPRDWGERIIFGTGLVAALAILRFVLSSYGAGRGHKIKFEKNGKLSTILQGVGVCEADLKAGFETRIPAGPETGAIQTSRAFNLGCISNPHWDVSVVDSGPERYQQIISELRTRSNYFRREGARMMVRKLFDGKALINENKIGVITDFGESIDRVEVYKSSYFATLCSADWSLKDINGFHGGSEVQLDDAFTRAPIHRSNQHSYALNPLSSSSPSISQQLGVNVIAVTKDRILRIAVQSAGTMFGQRNRVPLASGSMDWEDIRKGETFKDLIRRAGNREMQEEWGGYIRPRLLGDPVGFWRGLSLPFLWLFEVVIPRKQKNPLDMEGFLPVGIFRVPDRAGKPEAAVLARLNWDDAALIADTTEVYKVQDSSEILANHAYIRYRVDTFEMFSQAIQNLISGQGERPDTTPLFGVLCCIQDVIDEEPDRIRAVLGYPREDA